MKRIPQNESATGFEFKKHPVKPNLVAIVIPSAAAAEKPKDVGVVKKAADAAADDDEVELSESEYEEYSEYVTDSQVRELKI